MQKQCTVDLWTAGYAGSRLTASARSPMDKPWTTLCVAHRLPTGRRLPTSSTVLKPIVIKSGKVKTKTPAPALAYSSPVAVQTTGTTAEHLIPLPHQAVTLLKGMHTLTGTKKHLFPHRDDRTKPMVTASFRQMLHVLDWSGKFSPHATRTTGSTRLNEMGYSPDWIERQLAHEEPNAVRRTYNHADYFKDRSVMMQQWADLLDQWKKGESNVIPIKQERAA